MYLQSLKSIENEFINYLGTFLIEIKGLLKDLEYERLIIKVNLYVCLIQYMFDVCYDLALNTPQKRTSSINWM